MRDMEGSSLSTVRATDTDPVSMRVVNAIADTLECDPIDVEPLAASIDPEALDDVVRSGESTTVSFNHAGCTVRIVGRGSTPSIDVTRSVNLAD